MLPTAGSSELPKLRLQIKQDDKFYSRLLSKETSAAQPSFRVYYGVAPGAVPFLWESQPGTPKHTASSTTLPPLTPPPSYYYSSKSKSSKKAPKYSALIHVILPKLTFMRKPSSQLPPAVSSSSRSSSSSRGFDEESVYGSPTSSRCFGLRQHKSPLLPPPPPPPPPTSM